MTGKLVKLLIYRHETEKVTIVDSIEADDWGDFLIVAMDFEQLSYQQLQKVEETFNEAATQIHKKVILVPKQWNVEFYGIEKEPG